MGHSLGAGGYAEYAATDWGRVYKLSNASVDFVQAATLPIALQTAHEAITASGGFQRGEVVLVQGASSSVGLMSLQVARLLGASLVIGTSTRPERQDKLKAFGADTVVDTRDEHWPQQVLDATGGQGADLVVDFVAGATMNRNMQATRICGRIVNVGRMGGFTRFTTGEIGCTAADRGPANEHRRCREIIVGGTGKARCESEA